MENKQLNFSKPLLSARRCSPAAACQHSGAAKSLRTPRYRSEQNSGSVGNLVAVPFHWERIPGRPKEVAAPLPPRPPAAPALPPGRHPKAELHDRRPATGTDEPDMLSRTESSGVNCSVSGPAAMGENTAERLSADLQARTVLMDRFLSAAKVMADGPARFEAKKRPASGPEPVRIDKPDLGLDSHCWTGEGEEGHDDCDEYRNVYTACGLLSQFCMRNPTGIVNPVHAMNVGTGDRVKMQPEADDPKDKKIGLTKMDSRSEKDAFGGDGRVGDASYGCPNKGFKTFRELLADKDDPAEMDSGSSVVEKTVYVDTVQEVAGIVRSPATIKCEDAKGMDHLLHSVDSSSEDLKRLNVNGEGELLPDDTHTTEAGKAVDVKLSPNGKHSEFLVLPLLPPTPMDSWLWRTLPAMSAKTAQRHSYISTAASPQTYSSRAEKLQHNKGVQLSEVRVTPKPEG